MNRACACVCAAGASCVRRWMHVCVHVCLRGCVRVKRNETRIRKLRCPQMLPVIVSQSSMEGTHMMPASTQVHPSNNAGFVCIFRDRYSRALVTIQYRSRVIKVMLNTERGRRYFTLCSIKNFSYKEHQENS